MALTVQQRWAAGEGKRDWLFKAVLVCETAKKIRDFPLALLTGAVLRL